MPQDRRSSSPAPGSNSPALAPGMRVGGAGYALKKLVGRGGLGEVWVAWDRKQEKDVALKFLPQGLMRDPHLLELVQSQVEQARKLDHAVIVRIYDFVRDYENVAIAMEYVQGWSLAALKVDRPQKRYRVEELSKWVPALCLALEYAHHETNLVHRDLKPGNLLIDAREHVRITDFAISHAVRSALAQQGHLVYGAVAYMSPQQVKGALPSILDDVYSLGATVFDLLTGTPPFYAGEIMTQVFEVQPPTMSERLAQLEIAETLPAAWDQVVAAALAKDPAERPQSAGEFLKWLDSPPARPIPAPSLEKSPAEISLPPKAVPEVISEKAPEEPAQKPPEPAEQAATSEALEPEVVAEPASGQSLPADSPPAAPLELAPAVESNDPAPTVDSQVVDIPGTTLPARSRLMPVALITLGVVIGIAGLALVLHFNKTAPGATLEKMTGPPGSIDSAFHAGAGADNEVRALLFQPDGRLLVGGMFTNFDGTAASALARLDAQGAVETNFVPQIRGMVHAIAFQPDGKIVVGGDFMKVNGEARRRIARLNSSGDLDSSFNPRGALNREVRALLVQPDGKIVAGGGFDQTSGNRHNHVTRMNSDGKRDDSFNIGEGANGAVYCLALQSDGKLLVGGAFSRFGNTSSGHVTRLNADGSVDAGFKIGSGANAGVNDILLLPDGKILLAGGFTRFDGASCNRVVRLGPDGAVEGSFSVAAIPKGEVRCLAIQPGGKILVAGAFNSLAGMTRNGLARLNADGSLDQRFDTGQGATDGSLWSVAATKSGKVVIAGAFRDFNGTACGRITRLNGDVSATQKR